MACMFTMMNRARLAVGLQGVGIAERATQQATAYARERKPGRTTGRSSRAGLLSCSACSRSYGQTAHLRREALGQTLRVRSAEPCHF